MDFWELTRPTNLAEVRANCLYGESVLQSRVYQKHLFLLNYLSVCYTSLKSFVTPQVISKL